MCVGRTIRKAVVPAAGLGSRLAPLTQAVPKELLRVGTKPVIQHVLEALRSGGIREVLVIVGWKKGAILDYLGSGRQFGLEISYRVQEEPRGVGHAVSLAEGWVGGDDFAVMFGDNYFRPVDVVGESFRFHRQMRARATLVVHPVEDPRRFGIVRIGPAGRVQGLVEKPSLARARRYRTDGTYFNIAGLLVLHPEVFAALKRTRPGRGGEVWLTDAIERMRRAGRPVYAYRFRGERYDIGTFESLLEADRLATRTEGWGTEGVSALIPRSPSFSTAPPGPPRRARPGSRRGRARPRRGRDPPPRPGRASGRAFAFRD